MMHESVTAFTYFNFVLLCEIEKRNWRIRKWDIKIGKCKMRNWEIGKQKLGISYGR